MEAQLAAAANLLSALVAEFTTLGAKQTKLDAGAVEKLMEHAASVILIRLASSGRNALDFALAYYMGRAVSVNSGGKDFQLVVGGWQWNGGQRNDRGGYRVGRDSFACDSLARRRGSGDRSRFVYGGPATGVVFDSHSRSTHRLPSPRPPAAAVVIAADKPGRVQPECQIDRPESWKR
jgi:hypothetical protein